MLQFLRKPTVIFAGLLLTALGGCGGGGTSTTGGTGTVKVSLTDAPACGFEAVTVTVTKVRIHASGSASDTDGGWTDITLTPPRRINLLALTNGVLTTLGQAALPAGTYTQIRLVLQASTLGAFANAVTPMGAPEQPLDTPSAVQSGIKLINSFKVDVGQLVDLVLDFDACKSIVTRGNGTFGLKPVIRVIPMLASGSIIGNVDLASADAGATISAQKAGVVARSTIADATGAFVLSPILAADGPYDVVLTGRDRASAIATGVPVTAGTQTRVSAAGSSITLPASTTRTVAGTILPMSAQALVRAVQSIGSTGAEIGFVNANANGAYTLVLPIGAPQVAAYTTPLPLSFGEQTNAAARYTIEASAADFVTQTADVNLASANATINATLTPVP